MTLPHLTAHASPGATRYTRLSMASNQQGRPLPPDLQQKLSRFYDWDFSDVRIHEGPEPGKIGAVAFTHGNHIYMAPGKYDPHSEEGLKLLGHELTHVVQQGQGRVANPHGEGVAVVNDRALETEADITGAKAADYILKNG